MVEGSCRASLFIASLVLSAASIALIIPITALCLIFGVKLILFVIVAIIFIIVVCFALVGWELLLWALGRIQVLYMRSLFPVLIIFLVFPLFVVNNLSFLIIFLRIFDVFWNFAIILPWSLPIALVEIFLIWIIIAAFAHLVVSVLGIRWWILAVWVAPKFVFNFRKFILFYPSLFSEIGFTNVLFFIGNACFELVRVVRVRAIDNKRSSLHLGQTRQISFQVSWFT